MARAYKQGVYNVTNRQKYIGDPTKCVYRSGWELTMFRKLDGNPKVVAWASEEVIIPYISPLDNRPHRYFMDLIVVTAKEDGTKNVLLLEVKPHAQTLPPKAGKGRAAGRVAKETMTYLVNQAKWKAAEEFCAKRGWSFKVVTEKDVNF